MSNHPSKGKKRKLGCLEESSGVDSRSKEELDTNSDMESQEDSASEDSASTYSDSLKNSNLKLMRKSRTSKAMALLSDSSESGDENSEKCAICLRSIVNQEVGNPEVCDHLFCSVCIIEWSKNSNVCPLDRQQFSIILVRANKDGSVMKKVSVEEPQVPRMENVALEAMDDTVCEICGSGDREDIMLLCDNCDRGFHTICLTPPLENIPDENEWFCPNCESSFRGPDGSTAIASGLDDFLENVSTRFRSLRPRVQLVRTRLLERVRVTINRIVENYVLRQSDDDPSNDDYFSDESDDSLFSLGSSFDHVLSDQPSTSGAQPSKSTESKIETTKKVKGNPIKKTKKTTKRKKNTGSCRKKVPKKRKTKIAVKKKSSKRKVGVKTTRTKKVKIENPDGTIAEKIIKTRTYKRRKQKRRKKKLKNHGSGKRGLRVKSITTPKTVKGRLALMLGMVPPKKPGQLLPDIKIKPNNSTSAIDLNRARAGIPKLHIFGPRDELQCFSSESDQEDIVIGNSGGVATVAQQRSNLSRLRDRKKAALVLQSVPPTSTLKTKPVIEPPSERIDILGSILDSQAIWHSKDTNTNVKINSDGSIEVIKNKDSSVLPKAENKTVDVREVPEEATTRAPMYPNSGNRAGGFRPNRSSYGDSRSNQENMFAPRSGAGQSGMSFNRFGGPARNDREGYTNYLNNIPQGPTPFCRGGPPLRFRMPPRQQLRRISFPTRNRTTEQTDGNNTENKIGKKEKKEPAEETDKETPKVQEDEDVDLYSDIETNTDKMDNSGPEDSVTNYPALGPPPEPSAFLLGLDENNEFGVSENKDKSDVYDPAEPCDSEDEMVIDENQEKEERASTPDKKESQSEVKPDITVAKAAEETSQEQVTKPEPKSTTTPKASSEEDDEEDCPIFSIYSSASREFSQKEEEERQREIAEDKKKLEKMKLQEDQTVNLKTSDGSNPEKQNLTPSNIEDTESSRSKEMLSGRQSNSKKEDKAVNDGFSEPETKTKEKFSYQKDSSRSPSLKSARSYSRSRSKSVTNDSISRRSLSVEAEKARKSKSPISAHEKSSSPQESSKKNYKWVKGKNKKYDDSDSDLEREKFGNKRKNDKNDEVKEETKTKEKSIEENVSQKIATGLEGLDVEEVSSDGDAFADRRSLSSLSLSDFSHQSQRLKSPVQIKKKKKNKKRKILRSKGGKNNEEGELDDSDKDNRLNESYASTKSQKNEMENENNCKVAEKKRELRSASSGSERQILSSKENKKSSKEKSKELAWKKPSKKEKNYREGKKRSKDRARSKSDERRRSKSPSPKKDKKKNKDRKKKTEKKKDIERYDVRKIVKNKEIRKTDAFGRDIVSKSRSISKSRSRSPIRERSRNMLRRDSRSFSRSRSRSFRRGRSPIRRRYRSRSRSKSNRRSYSRSRSRSRSRKTRKKIKMKDRLKIRSRSRSRKSRSFSRGKRRSLTRSRSRSPIIRGMRSKKTRSRKSWSHHVSKSPSYSSRRSLSITKSPIRIRRSSYSRSMSSSWSRNRSPLPPASSLEKLTVVLTTKDKKKWKKKKDGKKSKKDEKKRKKTGNSKEVFASGDNVLVSVNFRNNSNATPNNGGSMMSVDSRNIHLNSLSPVPGADSSRKKKRSSDYESEKVTKKLKKTNPISKKVVDVALSSACPKRAKKLTRLSEKDAEVILNRKPVAVIDLDISPYREQTPSPVNVVVVSDSGSGDEGKDHTPQRPTSKSTPNREIDEVQDISTNQNVKALTLSSPVDSGYVPTSGPKTPPEPQIKFSINKPQQLRPIANPLGDDDDDEEDEADEEPEPRVESLDRRIEKELDAKPDIPHKGPNTPPAPRGPSTPKEPPSPQTSPDAYDPFEPTKSRSPSPSQADKENRLSPKIDDQVPGSVQSDTLQASVMLTDSTKKIGELISEKVDENSDNVEKGETLILKDDSSNLTNLSQPIGISVTDNTLNESPERKGILMMSTPQNKLPSPAIQKAYTPTLKQVPMVALASSAPQSSININTSTDVFSSLSPSRTSRSNACTTQNLSVTGIQRLQHRLGSPVNKIPNVMKPTPEKWSTPRTDSSELFSSGSYLNRNVNKRNGDPTKQPRPLQDATNETIDVMVDMDDSPYSPASSEGDDLFDPPVEPSKPSQSNTKAPSVSYKGVSTKPPPGKSPVKQLNKFDLLFGPTMSPLKVPNKKTNVKTGVKPVTTPNVLPPKPQKRSSTKLGLMHKMDEDQLRILDELPSSAVELQVKDKFLKKLNRQERVVDEVKTVLKPHYARKHITKEEYKDILRRSVPKICHSRSGEINPSKIQSLIEAYVRKFRHAKKKGLNITSTKPKVKKTMFS